MSGEHVIELHQRTWSESDQEWAVAPVFFNSHYIVRIRPRQDGGCLIWFNSPSVVVEQVTEDAGQVARMMRGT